MPESSRPVVMQEQHSMPAVLGYCLLGCSSSCCNAIHAVTLGVSGLFYPVCVAVRGDLIRILNKLLKRKNKFDAIMIETTGLANPAPVIQVGGLQRTQHDQQ